MPVLTRPWDRVTESGELAVVLAAAALEVRPGRLATDAYAWAERLGSHLRGRTDALVVGPEPGARLTARPIGAAEVEPLLAAPGRLRRGRSTVRGALPALYALAERHSPGQLVVLVVHPVVQAGLVGAITGDRRWRRPLDPTAACRTLRYSPAAGWRLESGGAWMPA